MKGLFTSLECQILKYRILKLIPWILALIIWCCSFFLHWAFGLFISIWLLLIVLIFAFRNNYILKYSYFRKKYHKCSTEYRKHISDQSEALRKYLHLGEIICLDDFLLFKKSGLVIDYNEIKNISYGKTFCGRGKPDFYYIVTIQTVDKTECKFEVWNYDTPFVEKNGTYAQIVEWIYNHQQSKKEK